MTEGAPAASPAPPDGGVEKVYDTRYAWRVMVILAGLVTVVLYVEGMLVPSLQSIQNEFGVDTGQVSLILSAYIVTGVALSPVVGKLGDIYGKKRILVFVLVIYAACVSVTGFSPNYTFMVVARAFQGVGLTVFPLGMALVREEFPREMVPKAQGVLSAMFGVGFAVSIPLGSWVSNSYGWRVTYHTAIPFVILLAILTFLVVRESTFRRPNTKVDYLGATLLGGALSFIVLALSEGESWGWTSALTLGFTALGVVLLVPLVLWERRYHREGGEAILDFRLLKKRNVLVTNLIGLIAGAGMYLALLSLVYLFETPAPVGFGQSILGAGLSLLPLALAMLILGPVAGILVSRMGTKPLTVIGSVLTGLGFLLAIFAKTEDEFLALEFLMGAGISVLNASVINLLVLTVEPRDMGLATSMNSVFRNVGSSLGAPISGSLLATYTVTLAPGFPAIPALLGFQWSFAIAAVVSLVGAVVVIFGEEVLGPRAGVSTARSGTKSPGSETASPAAVLGPGGPERASGGPGTF